MWLCDVFRDKQKKSAKFSGLLQRFGEIQQETCPVKRTNDSSFSFYDMRNDQINEYGEMPSINNPDNILKHNH